MEIVYWVNQDNTKLYGKSKATTQEQHKALRL